MKLNTFFTLIFCFISISLTAQMSEEVIIKQIVEPKLKELNLTQEEALIAVKAAGIQINDKADVVANQDRILKVLQQASQNKREQQAKTISIPAASTESTQAPTTPATIEKQVAVPAEPTIASPTPPAVVNRYGLQLINQYGTSPVSGSFDNYIIGEGDKIQINIFGKSQANLIFEVNAQGFIQPEQMPKIFVQNLSLKNAKKLLKERFSQYYIFKEGEFDASIYSSRSIRVSIMGEIAKPGGYEIKASQTLLNLINLAGGIQESGSIRNIQLIRSDKIITIDFYEFLKKPILPSSYFLQNNDIVKINFYENLIKIVGDVRRPMQYEMHKNESILDAINLSGGVLPSIYTDLVQLNTFVNGTVQTEEYNLKDILSKSKIILLKNGDELILKSAIIEKRPVLSISGEVLYGGNFDYQANNSLKKLLEKSQPKQSAELRYVFVKRKDFKNADQIFSINADNILKNKEKDFMLNKEDEIQVFSKQQYIDNFQVSIRGEVRKAQAINITYGDSLSVQTLIEFGGGLTQNATRFGYIYRKNPFNLIKTDYVFVDLNDSRKTYLKSGDQLNIYNISTFDLEKSIQINGEVNNPVSLSFSNNLTLKDLVILGEGLKLYADSKNISISRLEIENTGMTRKLITLEMDENFQPINVPDFSLKPFDIVTIRPIANIIRQDYASISGEIMVPGNYPILEKQNYFTDIVNQAKGFTGFADIKNILLLRNNKTTTVAFSPELALKNPRNSNYDPIIDVGDDIIVNRIKNSVFISKFATVGFADTLSADRYKEFLFDGSKNAYQFIKYNSGGIREEYSKKYIYVVQPNGKIKRTKSYWFFNVYPSLQEGDKIEVGRKPVKVKKNSDGSAKIDWDKTLTKILSIASTLTLIQFYLNK